MKNALTTAWRLHLSLSVVATDLATEHGGTDANKRDEARQLPTMSWNHTLSPLLAEMAPRGLLRGPFSCPMGKPLGTLASLNDPGGNGRETLESHRQRVHAKPRRDPRAA